MSDKWIEQEIDRLIAKEKDYKNVALLNCVKKYIVEIDYRITQCQAELDGKMWNPSEW